MVLLWVMIASTSMPASTTRLDSVHDKLKGVGIDCFYGRLGMKAYRDVKEYKGVARSNR